MKAKLLFVVLIAVLLASCGGGAAPAWKEFRSEAGAFSAQFPGTPKETTTDLDTAVGAIKLHSYTLEKGGIAYSVQYNDYPESVTQAGADVLLGGAIEGMTEDSDYTLLDQSNITLGEVPGREVKLSKSPENFIVRNRVYLAGARLYQVMVVVPKNKETASAKDVEQFLGSFKILK